MNIEQDSCPTVDYRGRSILFDKSERMIVEKVCVFNFPITSSQSVLPSSHFRQEGRTDSLFTSLPHYSKTFFRTNST